VACVESEGRTHVARGPHEPGRETRLTRRRADLAPCAGRALSRFVTNHLNDPMLPLQDHEEFFMIHS
jgi:hypothetical protein